MPDVTVTIHNASGYVSIDFRQGARAAWAPLNENAGGMQVSTATQFRVNAGAPFKFTKGSWTSGAYYNTLPIVGLTLKIQNQSKPSEYVQYDL